MKSLETMEIPMLHSLLKAYGDAYSAAINLRVSDHPRNDPYYADRHLAAAKPARLGRSWLRLFSAFL